MCAVSNKRAKLNFDSAVLWRHLEHISKKHIEKLQHDGLLDSTDIKSFEKCVSCMFGKMAKKTLLTSSGKGYRSTWINPHRCEYMSQEFLDHLKEHGIIAHQTPPYTPQHNGVSYRRNRTLLNMVRSMMSQTTLPKSFWDYGLESAARILNMVPTKKIDNTPYEVWHGQAPKLIPKGTDGIFFLLTTREQSLCYTSLNHDEDDQEIDEPQNDINPNHRSTRTRRAPDRMCLYINTEEHELGDLGEPANYKAALLDHESDKWLNAMNMKMQSMNDNENLGEVHWIVVKNILKYLHNTKDMFLVYGGDTKRELKVSCYTDDGYLTDADDMKSQTEYVFVLNGGVVDWKITKQSIFAASSTYAEYIALFDASKVAVWIRKFIFRLGVVLTIEEPINMYCDNTRAITIAKDHGVTKGARHFRAKVYYLRETIKIGDVRIEKVNTNDNLADPFAKALAFPKNSE
nr:putative retrotransposon protein [Tanacetum cinerariifolium]